MRETLLKLYQAQVLDNLVRAKKSYPIVQVDYSNLTGTVNQVANVNAGEQSTRTTNSPLATATGAVIRKISSYVLTYGGSAQHQNQLTMTGQPVITTDSVYQAYVEAVKNDPDIIKVLDDTVQQTDIHLTHRFEDKTWYVPTDKKEAFFRLYLATTVQRQTKVPVTLTVYTVIFSTVSITPKGPAQSQLQIRLKDKIANDSGQLTVAIDGLDTRLRYQPVDDVAEGKLTDRVLLNNPESETHLTGAQLADAIKGKDAALRNDNFVPGYVPPVVSATEPIRSQMELLRMQQFSR